MGDIGSHKACSASVKPLFPDDQREEFYNYFHLGNYFTDVSQFRDPTAFVSGKIAVWSQKRHSDWKTWIPHALDWIAHLDDYLDALMGAPHRPGKLGEWFRRINFTAGQDIYTRRHGGGTPPPIVPAEFERLFDVWWSQYWPHEHVDFPPWPFGSIIGEREASDVPKHAENKAPGDGSGARKIYKYTEDQIRYLTEFFCSIEQDWRERRESDDTDRKQLHDLLVRFGRACHAVEDFFFHSNFVELAWQRLEDAGRNPTGPDWQRIFRGGEHSPHEASPPDARFRRLLARRLREPMGSGMKLDDESSAESPRVYTGFFGGTDVFHTFADFLEGEASSDLGRIVGIMEMAGIESHFEEVLRYENRQRLRDSGEMTEHLKKHKRWLSEKKYEHPMLMARLGGRDARPGKSWIEAWEMDKKMFDDFSTADIGVYGFVANMLVMADKEHDESRARSQELDELPSDSEEWLASNNGASAECIGSHSLMSKDSVRKDPLRTPAVRLAKFASRYVGKTMMDRVARRPTLAAATFDPSTSSGSERSDTNVMDDWPGVDWRHLLEHFFCHPEEATSSWHEPVMLASDQDEQRGLLFDAHHTLRKATPEQIAEWRKMKTRDQLQKKYTDLEVDAERAWKKMLARDSTADTIAVIGAVVGAVVGAVAGAIAGAALGGAVGGPVGAVVGGILGAVGGAVLGALAGAAIGSLLGAAVAAFM